MTGTTTPDTRWSAPAQRPGEDHVVRVTPLDGLVLVVWSLLGQLVVAIGLALAGVTALEGPSLVAVGVFAQSVVLTGALAWLAGRGALSWRVLGSVPPSLALAGRGVVVGLGGTVLTAAVVWVASLVTDVAPAEQELVQQVRDGPTATVVLVVLAAVVMAPVVEELVFRAVLFQALARRLGVLPGALVSGLAFAVVHLELSEPAHLVALTVLGTLFALSLHRTRSLVVPVVAHATFNAVQLTLAMTIG